MYALQVNNMTCGGCARRVTAAVQSVDRAAKVEVDLPGKRITVESNEDIDMIAQAVSKAGYPATLAVADQVELGTSDKFDLGHANKTAAS